MRKILSTLNGRGPTGASALTDAMWEQRHRWVTIVLALHVPLLAVWAVHEHATRSQMALLALPVTAWLVARSASLTGGRLRPSRSVASSVATAGLIACSSILVSIEGGMTEMHFHFFVLVSLISLYEAWWPFLVSASLVLIEHGVVGMLWPSAVYGSTSMSSTHPWEMAFVHAGFFAAAWMGSLATWQIGAAARLARQELLDEQKALVRQLQDSARHDELTGLLNRKGLSEEAERLLGVGPEAAGLAVVVMDLDRFKDVNDTLGHSAGDQLLREVSDVLTAAVGLDGVLARLGGDEFAVLLPGCDTEEATGTARALLTQISGSRTLDGVAVSVGASAGIAVHTGNPDTPSHTTLLAAPRDEQVAEVLLREAEVAMYSAKAQRSGIAVYDPELDRHTAERLSTVEDLREALEVDDQLTLHYQPKVDLNDGCLVGVEALVRWHHPVRGFLPPSEFVAVAEISDLSVAFTLRVVELAVAQCARWQRDGMWIPVAVNISPRNLLRPGLVEDLTRTLLVHGVAPELLRVEITEDAAVSDHLAAIAVLAEMRALGIATSIDDFGTGFSSLSYLRRLPLDELKVDRSFVTGLGAGNGSGDRPDANEVLVASIIDLGHRLGMHVVAEGVEHEHERAVLQRLGCDSLQGYLVSRPVPAEALPMELMESALAHVAHAPAPRAPGPVAVPTSRV